MNTHTLTFLSVTMINGDEVVCDHATVNPGPLTDSERADVETRLFDAFPKLNKLVLNVSPTRQVSFHPDHILFITYDWATVDTDAPADAVGDES